MRNTGLRALSALWITIETCDQRTLRNCFSFARTRSTGVTSVPSSPVMLSVALPPLMTPGARSKRVIAYTSVDLPEPLSPATPSTLERRRSKDTSLTARTICAPTP